MKMQNFSLFSISQLRIKWCAVYVSHLRVTYNANDSCYRLMDACALKIGRYCILQNDIVFYKKNIRFTKTYSRF